MRTIEACTEVGVPVHTAYDQWTQFESFPRFMDAVRSVEQVAPTVTRWRIGLGPFHRDFHTEILEQHPDDMIRWRSLEGSPAHEGEVLFSSPAADRTALTMRIRSSWTMPAPLRRLVERSLNAQLRRFATTIEGLGDAGGGWRGTIHEGRVGQPEHIGEHPPTWPHG